jgi:hypothetical protein
MKEYEKLSEEYGVDRWNNRRVLKIPQGADEGAPISLFVEGFKDGFLKAKEMAYKIAMQGYDSPLSKGSSDYQIMSSAIAGTISNMGEKEV